MLCLSNIDNYSHHFAFIPNYKPDSNKFYDGKEVVYIIVDQ